jgi:hypothetical protein
MPPTWTDREWIAEAQRRHARGVRTPTTRPRDEACPSESDLPPETIAMNTVSRGYQGQRYRYEKAAYLNEGNRAPRATGDESTQGVTAFRATFSAPRSASNRTNLAIRLCKIQGSRRFGHSI